MGRLFLLYLDGQDKYSCKHCTMDLAQCALRTGFHQSHGIVHRFEKIVNLTHTPRAVHCVGCRVRVGLGREPEVVVESQRQHVEAQSVLERSQLLDSAGRSYSINRGLHMAGDDA